MKVLITGSSGFIGSSLVDRLAQLGHDVYGMSRYVASDSRYDFYQQGRRCICDVRNGDLVEKIIGETKPDTVIHLAAMSSVSYSFLSGETANEVTGVIYHGTMNVAHACQKHGVPHLIHASTSEFYGKQEKFPITEDATPQPLSPYAVAKLAAEEYLRFYERCYGLPVTIIRPYNTYNRSRVRKPHFVVERAITHALQNRHIRLYTPTPIRDLLDRDSHVDAYVKCLGKTQAIGEAINIGLSVGHTIGEMADMVAEKVGDKLGVVIPVSWDMEPDRPHDIHCLICANVKAQQLLGWHPLYTLDEGLDIAIDEWQEVLNAGFRI